MFVPHIDFFVPILRLQIIYFLVDIHSPSTITTNIPYDCCILNAHSNQIPKNVNETKKKEIERNICNKALMKISCKTHQEQSFLFMNSSKVRQSHLHLTCLVNIENNEHFIFMCLKHMLFMNHIVACLE